MDPNTKKQAGDHPVPLNAAGVLASLGYRAIARLGTGGMGEVYEAHGSRQGERVVVKVLHRDLAANPEMVDRMRVEAEILQSLSHPNIVAISDFGTAEGGRPYLVMERLYGNTLTQELARRGAFSLVEAVDCASQLLAALSAVHGEGFVHRDVKPSNLILCRPVAGRRRVKLIDFGVAKITGPGTGQRRPDPLEYPTMIGACIGTPRYASPEQAWGQSIDRRTDIYSAGLVLYALLTGRGPFDHIKGPGRLLEAHRSLDPEPPSKYAPQPLPRALDEIVLRAIAKDPEDRFPDAASFRRELTDVVGHLCIPMRQILDQRSGERRRRDPSADISFDTTVMVTRPECQAARAKRGSASGVRPSARAAHAPIEPFHVFLSAVAFAAVTSTLMLSLVR